jgi:hypothetical protein
MLAQQAQLARLALMVLVATEATWEQAVTVLCRQTGLLRLLLTRVEYAEATRASAQTDELRGRSMLLATLTT